MLRPWPWGSCWGSGLGPGVPAGDGVWRVWRVWTVLEGVWRVWKVLEGLGGLEGFGGCLEGLEGFGAFGAFAGWQTAALKANRKPLLWPWPWGVCLRNGLGPGAAALKAHRKPLLWPWPWGACWGSGLGPGVPAGQGVWRVWTVLESAGGFGGGFEGWSDRISSTPAVVPGTAPAFGGYYDLA